MCEVVGVTKAKRATYWVNNIAVLVHFNSGVTKFSRLISLLIINQSKVKGFPCQCNEIICMKPKPITLEWMLMQLSFKIFCVFIVHLIAAAVFKVVENCSDISWADQWPQNTSILKLVHFYQFQSYLNINNQNYVSEEKISLYEDLNKIRTLK